jgi:hypothetical protein
MAFEGWTDSFLNASRSLDLNVGITSSELAILNANRPYDGRSQTRSHATERDDSSMTSAHISWLDQSDNDTMSSSVHQDSDCRWTDSPLVSEGTNMEYSEDESMPIVDRGRLPFDPLSDQIEALDFGLQNDAGASATM